MAHTRRTTRIVLALVGLVIVLTACNNAPAPPAWSTAYQEGFESGSMPLSVTDISIPNNACTQQPSQSDASLTMANSGYGSAHAAALNVNIQHTPALYMSANVWHKLTSIQAPDKKRHYAIAADVKVDSGSEAGVVDFGLYIASGTANGSHGYWGAFQWVVNPYDSNDFGSVRVIRRGGATSLVTLKPDSKWHHVRVEYTYDPSSGLTIDNAAFDGKTYPVQASAVVSSDTSGTPYMGFAFDTLNAYTNCSTSNTFYGTSFWDNVAVQTQPAN